MSSPSAMEHPVDSDDDFGVKESRKLVSVMNRKNRKAGGFQVMGLSSTVYNGITKKGYKSPTPIQRKTIPLILTGRDVVAMARTGSGKTAAFLIPMFEKLQRHTTTGPRALILSPTRELALQTLKFTTELGKFSDLNAAVILGGERIIATPGRLLHLLMEMNFKLRSIEYVVFDEGDRLFELGFAEQLSETLHRLPRGRQTMIFSATLPNNLIEFARAGLSDPVLIRLDVDSKLSKNLKLAHISCLLCDKQGLLLHLLQTVVPQSQQAVVFFATKHHVEFFQMLLTDAHIACASIHSGLDPAARTTAIREFTAGRIRTLLVTDVAARGVDIPLLDNVINYHFPPQPKLFLHRVGRVARAGRSGLAYSLVDSDELPYLFDVFVFLGRSMIVQGTIPLDDMNDWLGRTSRNLACTSMTEQLVKQNSNMVSMLSVCVNAMKRYIRTRPKASNESVRRAKELRVMMHALPVHPVFPHVENETDEAIMDTIRRCKLPTIFEFLGRQANPTAYDTMAKRRRTQAQTIAAFETRQSKVRKQEISKPSLLTRTANLASNPTMSDPLSDETNLENTELFIPYTRGNELQELGLEVSQGANRFAVDAVTASMDLIGDELSQNSKLRPAGLRLDKQVWDRRRKRFMNADAAEGKANVKRIKTESGIWIPASYKTDRYKKWLDRSQIDSQDPMAEGQEDAPTTKPDGNKNAVKSAFSARFGGVIEFPDVEEADSKQKTWGKPSTSGRGLNVMGMQKWQNQAILRQREKKQNATEALTIRQPKGNHTYGQLRKPEQMLKRRREQMKYNEKKKENKFGAQGARGGLRGGWGGGGSRGGMGRGGGGRGGGSRGGMGRGSGSRGGMGRGGGGRGSKRPHK